MEEKINLILEFLLVQQEWFVFGELYKLASEAEREGYGNSYKSEKAFESYNTIDRKMDALRAKMKGALT